MVTHAEEDIFELLSKLDTLIGSLDRWSPSDLELLSNWLVDTMTEVNDKWESPECKEPGGIVVKHEVIDRSKVSTWLGKVLASPIFCCSRNHQKLLRYLVEQTLDGNGERLKGYCIGVKVFGRPTNFDPNLDAIVRVEAMRLRKKLCAYYQTHGRMDEVHFHLEKGSHAVIFHEPKQIGLL